MSAPISNESDASQYEYYMDDVAGDGHDSIAAAADAVLVRDAASQDDGRTPIWASAASLDHPARVLSDEHPDTGLTDAADGTHVTPNVQGDAGLWSTPVPVSQSRRSTMGTANRSSADCHETQSERPHPVPSAQRMLRALLPNRQYETQVDGSAPARLQDQYRNGSGLYVPLSAGSQHPESSFTDLHSPLLPVGSILQRPPLSDPLRARSAQYGNASASNTSHDNSESGDDGLTQARTGPDHGSVRPHSSMHLPASTITPVSELARRAVPIAGQHTPLMSPHEQRGAAAHSHADSFDRFLQSSATPLPVILDALHQRVAHLEASQSYQQQLDLENCTVLLANRQQMLERQIEQALTNIYRIDGDLQNFALSIGTVVNDHASAYLRDTINARVEEAVTRMSESMRQTMQTVLHTQSSARHASHESTVLDHCTHMEDRLNNMDIRIHRLAEAAARDDRSDRPDTEVSATPTAGPDATSPTDMYKLRSEFAELDRKCAEFRERVTDLTREVHGVKNTSAANEDSLAAIKGRVELCIASFNDMCRDISAAGVRISKLESNETSTDTNDKNDSHEANFPHSGGSATDASNSGGPTHDGEHSGGLDDTSGGQTPAPAHNVGHDPTHEHEDRRGPGVDYRAHPVDMLARQNSALLAHIQLLEAQIPWACDPLQNPASDEALDQAQSIPDVSVQYASTPMQETRKEDSGAPPPSRRPKSESDDFYCLVDGYGRKSATMYPNLAVVQPESLAHPVVKTDADLIVPICDQVTLQQIQLRPNSMYKSKPSDDPTKHIVGVRHGLEEMIPGELKAFASQRSRRVNGSRSANRVFLPIEVELLSRLNDGRSPYHGHKNQRWYFNSAFNFLNIGDLLRARAADGHPLTIGPSEMLANQLRTFTHYNSLYTAFHTNIYQYFWLQVERCVGVTTAKPVTMQKLRIHVDQTKKPLWSTPKQSHPRTQKMLSEASQELISLFRSANYLRVIERMLVGRVIIKTTEDATMSSFISPDRKPFDQVLEQYRGAYMADHSTRVSTGQVLANMGGLTQPVEPTVYPQPQGSAPGSHNPYDLDDDALDADVFGTRRGHSLQALFAAVHHMYHCSPMDRLPKHTATEQSALYKDITALAQSSLCTECMLHKLQDDARGDDTFIIMTVADLEEVQQNVRELLTVVTDEHGRDFVNQGDMATCTGFGLLLKVARSWRDSPFYIQNTSFAAAQKFVLEVNGPRLLSQGHTIFRCNW